MSFAAMLKRAVATPSAASETLSRDAVTRCRAAADAAAEAVVASQASYREVVADAVAAGAETGTPEVQRAHAKLTEAKARHGLACDALAEAETAAAREVAKQTADAEKARRAEIKHAAKEYADAGKRFGDTCKCLADEAKALAEQKEALWRLVDGKDRAALELGGCVKPLRPDLQVELERLGVLEGMAHPSYGLAPPSSIADRAADWLRVLTRGDKS